jgi:uncharacterized protein (DUF488 family)
MTIFTIGFTRKSAETFFTKLKECGARRVVDVRLNNVSQLAGFTKKDDLPFFLREICGMEYLHLPILAPTQALLDSVRKGGRGWAGREREFLALMKERKIEKRVSRADLDGACLLCSEETPEHCHRRLVAEYLPVNRRRLLLRECIVD